MHICRVAILFVMTTCVFSSNADESQEAAETLLKLAEINFSAGRYSHSKTFSEAVLSLDPNNVRAKALLKNATFFNSDEMRFHASPVVLIDDTNEIKTRQTRRLERIYRSELAPFEPVFMQKR